MKLSSFKKWSGLVVLLSMITIILAACGDATATSAPSTTAAASAAATSAAGTSAATTAAAGSTTAAGTSATTTAGAVQTVAPVAGGDKTGVTDTEIKIGNSAAQSGGASAYGIGPRVAAAYFKMINEQGGIYGRKLTLLYEDDVYQAAKSLANVKKLAEQDKVFAFLGNVGTANNLAFKDYLNDAKIPNVAFVSGSGALVNPGGFQKYGFGLLPSYTFEGTMLAQYAAEKLGVKTAAVVYQNDGFGKEAYASFVKTAKDKGINIVSEVSYETGATDLSSQALKLQQSNADLVFVNAVPGPGATVVKEMDKLGYKPKLEIAYVMNDTQFYAVAGKTAEGAISTLFTPPLDGDDPKVAQFKQFMAKYLPNEQIGAFAMWGYVSAQLMVEALTRAGKDLSRESLVAALESIKDWNGTPAVAITYGADNRAPFNALYFTQYKDGKVTKLSDPVSAK